MLKSLSYNLKNKNLEVLIKYVYLSIIFQKKPRYQSKFKFCSCWIHNQKVLEQFC